MLAAPDVGPDTRPEAVRLFRAVARTYLACIIVTDMRYSSPPARRLAVYVCSDDENERLYLSPENLACYRPSICVNNGVPAAAYDAWDGESYHIYMQFPTGVRRISEGAGWNIAPDIALDSEGRYWACWIHTRDVASSNGVVDAKNAIHVACIDGDARIEYIEDISHGLLDTDPEPRGVWGYLGRRRHPMLVLTRSGLKLVWEQKRRHAGGTRENRGVLWMRDVNTQKASEPVALIDDCLWYEAPGSKQVDSNSLLVACIQGVYTDERSICIRDADPDKPVPAENRLSLESWQGWKDISLPENTQRRERPQIETPDGTYFLYWFDLHCHSVMSADAEGELDECVRTGRYKAQLDGLLITDNDHYVVPLNRGEWRNTWEMMDEMNEDGRFIALTGYEWTSRPIIEDTQIVDHRSVILPAGCDDIIRWNEVDGDINALYAFVRNECGLVHAHHQDWRLTGHPVEANIEACSSWNPYLEIDPGPFHRELARGHKIGVIGGSDEHRRNPGLGGSLTGIWAKELTRESIIDALRSHRCYATMGRRVVLDFRVNAMPMGTTVPCGPCRFFLSASGLVQIAFIELYEDGECIHTWRPDALQIDVHLEHMPTPGNHAYYAKLILEGDVHRDYPANIQPLKGPGVWSSPVWVGS